MKKIKYIYFFLMFFYFVLHFILPGAFYLIKGYSHIYSDEYYDIIALIKGILLNFFSLGLGAFLIYITKIEFKIKEVDYKSRLYLIFCVLFTIGSAWTIGHYTNALNSLNSPTGFFVFFGMFFTFELYFLFALATSRDFLPSSQLLVVFKGLVSASRSASLSIFLLFIYSLWSNNVLQFAKKYFIYFIIAFSLSFFAFRWADQIRNKTGIDGKLNQSTTIEVKIKNSFQVSKSLLYIIAQRLSFMETTMIPITTKDRNPEKLDIFYEKYSLTNQAKMVLNNILPGQLFKFDVYPCQYYRAAFVGMSIKDAQEIYTSLNMTLPVYLYMYFNFFIAILLGGIAIWIYYLLTLAAFKIHPLAGSVFISIFYSSFLVYFDWVMVIKPGVIGILAIAVFILTSKLQVKIMELVKGLYKER